VGRTESTTGRGDAYPECVGEDARQAARNRITEMYVERFGNVSSEEKGAELIRELLDDPDTSPAQASILGEQMTAEWPGPVFRNVAWILLAASPN
jgi:hypothetical protein